MRVFLTGGTGGIGAVLARDLRTLGYEPRPLAEGLRATLQAEGRL